MKPLNETHNTRGAAHTGERLRAFVSTWARFSAEST